jgi:hypothetical protein
VRALLIAATEQIGAWRASTLPGAIASDTQLDRQLTHARLLTNHQLNL